MELCSFEDCDKPVKYKNLCTGHVKQYAAGKTLKPLQRRPTKKEREAVREGMKVCAACKEEKSIECFSMQNKKAKKYTSYCKPCFNNLSRNKYRQKQQEYLLMRNYGLSLSDYQVLLEAQHGGCAICGMTPEENGKALAVDHDHSCCPTNRTCGNCVRNLLCNRCNTMLGQMNDDIDLLQRAVLYLENHAAKRKVRLKGAS